MLANGVGILADAKHICIRISLPQKEPYRFQRALIAQIAAAEIAEKTDALQSHGKIFSPSINSGRLSSLFYLR